MSYGPWQPGLTHVQYTSASGLFGFYENPQDPHPNGSIFTGLDQNTQITSGGVSGPGYPAGTPTFLKEHGLLQAAADCAWVHVQAPDSGFADAWWPEQGGDWVAACPPVDNRAISVDTRNRFWGGNIHVTYNGYTYSLAGGDAATWTMALQPLSLIFRAADFPSGDVAPPRSQWPADAIGVDFQPGKCVIDDVAYLGSEWVPDPVDSSDPLTYIRLWAEGDTTHSWWPVHNFYAPNNEGFNLWPEVSTVTSHEYSRPANIRDGTSLSDWVDLLNTDDGKTRYLEFIWLMPWWLTKPDVGSGEARFSQGAQLSMPNLAFTIRSNPYRYIFPEPPPTPTIRQLDSRRAFEP